MPHSMSWFFLPPKALRILMAALARLRACRSVRTRFWLGAFVGGFFQVAVRVERQSEFSCCDSVITTTEFDFGLNSICSGMPALSTTLELCPQTALI